MSLHTLIQRDTQTELAMSKRKYSDYPSKRQPKCVAKRGLRLAVGVSDAPLRRSTLVPPSRQRTNQADDVKGLEQPFSVAAKKLSELQTGTLETPSCDELGLLLSSTHGTAHRLVLPYLIEELFVRRFRATDPTRPFIHSPSPSFFGPYAGDASMASASATMPVFRLPAIGLRAIPVVCFDVSS